MLRIILLVFLVLLIFSALPFYPYSRDWGYWPSGGGVVLLILLLIFIFRADREI